MNSFKRGFAKSHAIGRVSGGAACTIELEMVILDVLNKFILREGDYKVRCYLRPPYLYKVDNLIVLHRDRRCA